MKGGQPLPADQKAQMEKAFDTDFSDVRIHENSGVPGKMGALAYTQGSDVHFAPGQYQPGTAQGQKLIAHELTHVVQQKQGRAAPGGDPKADPVLGGEAAMNGMRVPGGEPARVYGDVPKPGQPQYGN